MSEVCNCEVYISDTICYIRVESGPSKTVWKMWNWCWALTDKEKFGWVVSVGVYMHVCVCT